jgi:hypothetical protein
MKHDLYKPSKFDNCQCEIRWENSGLRRPALYCTDHDIYIKWLSERDAFFLIDELNLPENPYLASRLKKIRTQVKTQDKLKTFRRRRDLNKKLKRSMADA